VYALRLYNGEFVMTNARSATIAAAVVLCLAGVSSGADWVLTGPTGGRVHDLLVDPADPARVYAASGGNVYRSVDGGQSWHRVLEGDGLVDLAASPSGHIWCVSNYFHRLVVSTDRGDTWTEHGINFSNASSEVDEVAPYTDSTVYGLGTHSTYSDWTTTAALYVSTDGGVHWSVHRFGPDVYGAWAGGLIVDPSGNIYAGLEYHTPDGTLAGVYKSEDSGGSWEQVLETENTSTLSSLSYDAVDDVLFVGGSFWDGSQRYGFLRSTDGGVNWQPSSDSFSTDHTSLWANWSFLIDSATSYLYAGMYGDIWVSQDDGATWQLDSEVAGDRDGMEVVSPVRFSDGSFLAGTGRQGFYQVSSGGTWSASNSGFYSRNVTDVEVTPGDSQTLYLAADGGLYRSTNGGTSWTFIRNGAQDVQVLPANPDHIVVADWAQLNTSVDGGASWTDVDLSATASSAIRGIAADPAQPSVV